MCRIALQYKCCKTALSVPIPVCKTDTLPSELPGPLLRSDKGFTLLELMVVLVLVGLLSSLVFVSISGGLFRSDERRFVKDFSNGLFRARNASLGRGDTVPFLIDGEERRFSVGGTRWQEIPESVQVEGEGVTRMNKGIYGILFFPDGSSSGGELDLKLEEGGTARIYVDKLLGIIRITLVPS